MKRSKIRKNYSKQKWRKLIHFIFFFSFCKRRKLNANGNKKKKHMKNQLFASLWFCWLLWFSFFEGVFTFFFFVVCCLKNHWVLQVFKAISIRYNVCRFAIRAFILQKKNEKKNFSIHCYTLDYFTKWMLFLVCFIYSWHLSVRTIFDILTMSVGWGAFVWWCMLPTDF